MPKVIDENKSSQIKELFKAGAHFGFSRSRRHPSASPFIFGFKNKTAIIDLEKSLEELDKVKNFVAKLAGESKQILFVGNKNEVRDLIKAAAAEIDMPYVAERWIGGTFSNFEQIKSRVAKLKDIEEKEKDGNLSIYTKKEQGLIGKEAAKLKRYFSGISNMAKIPAAVVVIDAGEERVTIEEVRGARVPIIAISGTDCDLNQINYPIVANDTSRVTVQYFLREIVSAYKEGKKTPKVEEGKSETAIKS